MKCSHCGKTIMLLPFTCSCCGKRYCLECRMPDSHTCQPHRKNWSAYADNHFATIATEQLEEMDRMEQESKSWEIEPEALMRPEEFDNLR